MRNDSSRGGSTPEGRPIAGNLAQVLVDVVTDWGSACVLATRGSAASCHAQTLKPRVADDGRKSAATATLDVASRVLRLGPKSRVEQKVPGLAANHAVLAQQAFLREATAVEYSNRGRV
jgi:hypothetical protein